MYNVGIMEFKERNDHLFESVFLLWVELDYIHHPVLHVIFKLFPQHMLAAAKSHWEHMP